MDFSHLAAVEVGGAFAYVVALALISGALPVTPERLRFSCNCFFAGCAIFIGVGLVWGIFTDESFLRRTIAVFVIAGIGGVAAAETARFFKREIGEVSAPKLPAKANLPSAAVAHPALGHPPVMPALPPEIQQLLAQKEDLRPALKKYIAKLGAGATMASVRTPEAIVFYNEQLVAAGISWRVTPENIDTLLGNTFINTTAEGTGKGGGIGISMGHSKGNIFHDTKIGGVDTAIDMGDSQNNKFSKTQIDGKPAGEK